MVKINFKIPINHLEVPIEVRTFLNNVVCHYIAYSELPFCDFNGYGLIEAWKSEFPIALKRTPSIQNHSIKIDILRNSFFLNERNIVHQIRKEMWLSELEKWRIISYYDLITGLLVNEFRLYKRNIILWFTPSINGKGIPYHFENQYDYQFLTLRRAITNIFESLRHMQIEFANEHEDFHVIRTNVLFCDSFSLYGFNDINTALNQIYKKYEC